MIVYKFCCHSEPVRTLAWESPKQDGNVTQRCSETIGDCHTSLRAGSQ